METLKTTQVEKLRISETISEEEFDKNFKPRGAIAFFVLLVILGALIWYGIYYIMLTRA